MAANGTTEGPLLDRQLWAEQRKISARAEPGGNELAISNIPPLTLPTNTPL